MPKRKVLPCPHCGGSYDWNDKDICPWCHQSAELVEVPVNYIAPELAVRVAHGKEPPPIADKTEEKNTGGAIKIDATKVETIDFVTNTLLLLAALMFLFLITFQLVNIAISIYILPIGVLIETWGMLYYALTDRIGSAWFWGFFSFFNSIVTTVTVATISTAATGTFSIIIMGFILWLVCILGAGCIAYFVFD